MVQHILVAHDLSPDADLALGRAAQLARQTGARLSVLHVLAGNPGAAEQRNAQSYLQTTLERHGLAQLQPWIRKGRAAEEILTQAAGLEIDLLVMGRHHRQSPQGFAGTTLEQVLQNCPAPLLLAVAPAAPYSQALAALDYSSCANRALQAAWQLLPAASDLTALNIYEMPDLDQPSEPDLALQRELFDQLLSDLQAGLDNSSARLHSSLRHGERNSCLDSAIAALQPQLLALGSHSRGEISNALLGSLTRQYLDLPPCDVLISH
ncbi:universal stress protein [Stutzerimonas zhaodongensis]|uniref:Universal stress protein n=1 Tax=Stutzerimonas zhaodongensis TaxID=1176257 RepID=A0A365PWA4_9GAMM|nr:universal stress protein [Stutzerimonas zhaodongensis]QWV17527.1 universal stress protein [Stutzerimonas zhaodongensis]RBA58966.1 universal stress protein [Stutzerimonas zhaodongensis]